MGGNISAEREQTSLAQNELFQRYKSTSTLESLQAESQRWNDADNTIARMPLEQQAEYADYVTRAMCDPQGEYAKQTTSPSAYLNLKMQAQSPVLVQLATLHTSSVT